MKTINIIGDSHTAALGPRLQSLLADFADVQFESFPGFSTARVLSAITGVTQRPADMTIVILGGNDFGHRDTERMDLLDHLRAQSAGKILWVGPAHSTDPHVDARHRQQADEQREQFNLLGVDWLDSYSATQQGHGTDGVHFTRSGYDWWSHAIAVEARSRLQSSFWPTIGWSVLLGLVGGIIYKTLRLGKK